MAEFATPEMIQKVLNLVPQQKPFRFIDELTELTEDHVVGYYTYKEDEYFYPGHFPGNPTTPGVILIETMAQVAVVAQGIYMNLLSGGSMEHLTLFTECEVDFHAVVPPNSRVRIEGKKLFFRRNKLKSEARITLEDGTLVASGTLAGVGVKQS